MNQHLQRILDLFQKNENLSSEQRSAVLKSLADAGKELELTAFKLDRTEKVKKTTAILLEQTIAELEQKRKAVEEQNRELEIEAALERVRSAALAMKQPVDMLEVCKIISQQLNLLKVKEIRNVQTAIFNEGKATYTNYEYYIKHDKVLITETDFKNHPVAEQFANQMMKGPNEFFTHGFEGNEVKDWLNYQRTTNVFIDTYLETASSLNYYWYSLGPVALGISAYASLSEEEINLFKRFRNVFELAYRRYLDIEKAEAQARESQIQLALERVRARTMAMYKSEELAETAQVLFLQLEDLGVIPDRISIGIVDETKQVVNFWTTDQKGSHLDSNFSARLNERTVIAKTYKAWKEQQQSLVIHLQGEELKEWIQFAREEMGIVVKDDSFKNRRVHTLAFFSHGWILVSTLELQSPEGLKILERFASVFNLTYTRFLDLQKAEEQARESKIQLALERVRARTMAMQKSDELAEVAMLLFKQVAELGIKAWTTGFNVWSDDNNYYTDYITSPQGNFIEPYTIDATQFQAFKEVSDAKKRGEEFYVSYLEGDLLKETYQELSKFGDEEQYKKMLEGGFQFPTQQRNHFVFGSKVSLMFITYEPIPEAHDIFKRFGKVFEQTYTRFLDLQKAEAQAKEAQIEAALEKVRSRSLAMQNTNELGEVAGVVSQKLRELHFGFDLGAVIILTFSQSSKDHVQWAADPVQTFARPFKVPYTDHSITSDITNAKESRLDFFSKLYPFEEKNKYFEYLFANSDYRHLPDDVKKTLLESKDYGISIAFETNSAIFIPTSTGKLLSKHETEILKRFAKVFEQSYIRFLDLQKAEASARESQIEAALEKVRGKAMAMHNSNDLSVTASMVFTELRKLGITPIRCGVGLLNQESRKAQLYSATSSTDGDSLSLVGWVLLEGHPVLEKIYDTWLKNEDYYPELAGPQLQSYYELLLAGLSVKVPDWQDGQKQYGHFISFSIGCLYAWSESPYDETEIKILKRFASIIDLTFRRYIELQKSEANAREAVKQAALDRVRAEIASMRTVPDLEKITPLIWNELTILGIPFIRCGVFIMDDSEQRIHTFLSTPDGKAIAAFHIPFDTPGNIAQVLSHWKDKKNYVDHWDEKEFTEFADTLVNQGALTSSAQYLQTIPHGGFYLHFLPFVQGMLYVGNSTQLNEEEIKLIQSLADAFSTAYARYEDFNKLDFAKKQVDSTLNELQATQKQLIQSEKMASLGELTAGIAHEIQNPLNFVNNFAEVNSELVDELKQEALNGNAEEVRNIAQDLKDNNQKIAFHGKRAESIVKGMLQHSRTSTGKKELTDINALADEFLRLSYHGLRAKDKSFNATMETKFDESIGKVEIVPQDLGRVLLNLFNNAFYSVNEKKKFMNGSFDPKVLVSTERQQGKIEIIVKDNGTGIPQKVIDKIYQPFFTTKPTGEGTGLGLSLSYDIITKGHNGQLKVETNEGEFAQFTIILPA